LKTAVDTRLVDEAARFQLRFACDDCVHFAAERESAGPGGSCGNGWPTRLRRSALDPSPSDPPLAFCKEFELA
jgi:hypothetical protein